MASTVKRMCLADRLSLLGRVMLCRDTRMNERLVKGLKTEAGKEMRTLQPLFHRILIEHSLLRLCCWFSFIVLQCLL